MNLLQGAFYGLLAAVTFGLIPLFTLPVIEAGYSVHCILFYRFFLGFIAMALLLRSKNMPILVNRRDSIKLTGLGSLYMLSGIPFFSALAYLDSGVVATVQFSYPVLVVVIMVCFFGEKLKISTACAVLMAFGGVALLSIGDVTGPINATGISLTILSATLTALYVTGLQVIPLQAPASGISITIYPFMCGTVFTALFALANGTLEFPRTPEHFMYFALQALVTGVVSNVALVAAVKRIGSTLAAVLGAIEPVVAVSVGVMVFGEAFTAQRGLGAGCIVSSVLVVMLAPYLHISAKQRKA